MDIKIFHNSQRITSGFEEFIRGGMDTITAYSEELENDLKEFHRIKGVHIDLALMANNLKCITIYVASKDDAIKLLEANYYGLKSLVYETAD